MMSTLFLAVSLLATDAPASAAGQTPTDVVARAGSFELTREMMDAYWNALAPARRASYEAGGGKRAFVEELLDIKLVVAEAERLGLTAKPALRAELDIARDTILYRTFLEQEVTQKIITDEAMAKFYELNKNRFQVEEKVRARQIVVTPHADKIKHNESGDDATTEAEAQAKAERLLAELNAGADFSDLARKQSEDTSARAGGILEDFPRGKMAKAIDDAAFSLAPGKISGVLRSPYGFHLLKLEAKMPAHTLPFAEVKEAVARGVAEERKDAFQPRWEQNRDRLRAASRIEIDDRALPQRAAPAATPAAGPGK